MSFPKRSRTDRFYSQISFDLHLNERKAWETEPSILKNSHKI